MTSTNDGKDVKSNQTSGQKGKTYFIELYKTLDSRLNAEGDLRTRVTHLCEAWRRVHTLCLHSAPPTHPHLLSWIQRHTARTILLTEWQSPNSKDEHTKLDDAINTFIQEIENASSHRESGIQPWESQLRARAEWFKTVLSNPWGHPVLRVLLDPRGQRPTTDDILGWLKEERGVVFAARLRQLALAKCDDLALTLLTVVMDRVRRCRPVASDLDLEAPNDPDPQPEDAFENILNRDAGFAEQWDLLCDMELVLLHKSERNSRLIDLSKMTPLNNGYQLVERLINRLELAPREKKIWKNAKDVATLISQVMITRCMVLPSCTGVVRSVLYWCSRALVRSLPASRLGKATLVLAAPASTARHLHTLATAVHAQTSAESQELKPFVVELFVRAITFGMNELEKLKLKPEYEEKEARSTEQTLASWFIQLGQLLGASARMKCECTLTAFSVHPSPIMYERIKTAPRLPPVAVDAQDLRKELPASTSEFGSWASDSRSQTNFVKTSESLNIKHPHHQANVLSTAILNEGETLGLEADLCQDIIVLLSGPRVKTLSWDVDREILLENCRVYMERTHGGTRTLTTELKYLNLDPSQYQHLPEEEDNEDDIYYGIEKGYEHLVEFEPQPEEIWEDAFQSVYSSDFEEEVFLTRRKKKTKKISSESDSDPLSLVAEYKRTEKKERPHSKERSKEPDEQQEHNDGFTISSTCKESHKPRGKKKDKKEKKKEKKERKKREKKTKSDTTLSYVGTKLTKMTVENSAAKNVCVTDSDYDSQGKSSLQSEGMDENVVYDGQFSMDELKSPGKSPEYMKNLNNELNLARQQMTKNLSAQGTTLIKNVAINNISQTKFPYTSNTASNKMFGLAKHSTKPDLNTFGSTQSPKGDQNIREEVKKSINKLMQFRRQKVSHSSTSSISPIQTNQPSSSTETCTKSRIAEPKSQNSATMHLNKKQTEQLNTMKTQAKVLKNQTIHNPTIDDIVRPEDTCSRVQPFHPARIKNMATQNLESNNTQYNVPSLSPQRTDVPNNSPNQKSETQAQIPLKISQTVGSSHFNSYQQFLEELQKNANAGLQNPPSPPKQTKKKRVLPVSRVTPIVPNVTTAEPTIYPQCAKTVLQKKVENAPNTFARLSYMHKNKLNEKPKPEQPSPALQHSISDELDRRIAELKLTKAKAALNKTVSTSRSKPKEEAPQVEIFKVEPTNTKPSKLDEEHPVLSDILKNTGITLKKTNKNIESQDNVPHEYSLSCTPKSTNSSLTEKDHQEILKLLGQQSLMNAYRSQQQSQIASQANKINTQFATGDSLVCPSNKSTTGVNVGSSMAIHNVEPSISTNNFGSSIPLHNVRPSKSTHSTITSLATNNTGPSTSMQNFETAIATRNIQLSILATHTADSSLSKSNVELLKTTQNVSTVVASQSLRPCMAKQNVEKSIIKKKNKTNRPAPAQELERTIEIKKEAPLKLDETNFQFPVISNTTIIKTTAMIKNSKDVRPKQSKAKGAQRLKKEVQPEPTKILEVNKTVAKKYEPKPPAHAPQQTEDDLKEQNWTKVLDALRSHKTPSRGPNALEMLLNKDTFQKVTERNPRVNSPNGDKLDKTPTVIKQVVPSKSTGAVPKVILSHSMLKKINSQNTCPHKARPNLPNPLQIYPEVTKQEFKRELQKEKDPFISGIPHSDYEILEELMDDDLRQEIGELSSDEESYQTAALPMSKGPKVIKNTDNIIKTNAQDKQKPLNPSSVFDVHSKTVVPNAAPKDASQSLHSKPRIISNEKVDILNLPESVIGSVIRKVPNMASKLQDRTVLNVNNTSVSTSQVPPSINPANVIITPTSNAVPNMVIYDPFGVCSNQNFVTMNTTPHVTLFQQYNANQIIIGSNTFAVPAVNTNVPVNIMYTNNQTTTPHMSIIQAPIEESAFTATSKTDLPKPACTGNVPSTENINEVVKIPTSDDSETTPVSRKLSTDSKIVKKIEPKVTEEVESNSNMAAIRKHLLEKTYNLQIEIGKIPTNYDSEITPETGELNTGPKLVKKIDPKVSEEVGSTSNKAAVQKHLLEKAYKLQTEVAKIPTSDNKFTPEHRELSTVPKFVKKNIKMPNSDYSKFTQEPGELSTDPKFDKKFDPKETVEVELNSKRAAVRKHLSGKACKLQTEVKNSISDNSEITPEPLELSTDLKFVKKIDPKVAKKVKLNSNKPAVQKHLLGKAYKLQTEFVKITPEPRELSTEPKIIKIIDPKVIEEVESNSNKAAVGKHLEKAYEVQTELTASQNKVAETIKNQNTIESNEQKDVKDIERVAEKRQTIINRQIEHRLFYPAIPLSYGPLNIQSDKEQKKSRSSIADHTEVTKLNNELQKVSTVIESATLVPEKTMPSEDILNNTQINKDCHPESYGTKSCRRILLRSSNTIIPETGKTKNVVSQKTKVRLKALNVNHERKNEDSYVEKNSQTKAVEFTTDKKSYGTSEEKPSTETTATEQVENFVEEKSEVATANVSAPTRVSKRLLSKKVKKTKEKEGKLKAKLTNTAAEDEKPKSLTNKQLICSSLETCNNDNTEIVSKVESGLETITAPQELFDVEEALVGAKILKANKNPVRKSQQNTVDKNKKPLVELNIKKTDKMPTTQKVNLPKNDTIEMLSSPELCFINADPLDKIDTAKIEEKIEVSVPSVPKNEIESIKSFDETEMVDDLLPKEKNEVQSTLDQSASANNVVAEKNVTFTKDTTSGYVSNCDDKRSSYIELIPVDRNSEVINKFSKLVTDIASALNVITETTIGSPRVESPVDKELVDETTKVKQLIHNDIKQPSMVGDSSIFESPKTDVADKCASVITQCEKSNQKEKPPEIAARKSPSVCLVTENKDQDITDSHDLRIEKEKSTLSYNKITENNAIKPDENTRNTTVSNSKFKGIVKEVNSLLQSPNAEIKDLETNIAEINNEKSPVVNAIINKSALQPSHEITQEIKDQSHNVANNSNVILKNTCPPQQDKRSKENENTKLKSAKSTTKSQSNENIQTSSPKPGTATEKYFSQSFKDSLMIEEIAIPGNVNPLKRCIRIKLPNNKYIRVTVHSKFSLSLDTLFEEPSFLKLIQSNIKEHCSLSIPLKVFPGTQTEAAGTSSLPVQDYNNSRTNIETVNLVSDDEDILSQETTTEASSYKIKCDDKDILSQVITTEAYSYKIKSINEDVFKKHQEKLLQKCCIKLRRCDERPKTDVLTKALLTDYGVSSENPEPSEIIEIDSSSDDELTLSTNIDNLKDLLLKDLGVADINISESDKTDTPKKIPSRTRKPKPHRNPDKQAKSLGSEKRIAPVKRHSSLVTVNQNLSKPDYSHLIPHECIINLVRCDHMIKNRLEQTEHEHNDTLVDEEKIHGDDQNDAELKRTGSFSLLNYLEEAPAIEQDISPVRISSPVMEVYDMIATLQEKSKRLAVDKLDNGNICACEWFETKRSQNLIIRVCGKEQMIESRSDIATDCETDVTDLSDTESIEVPKLKSIMAKYFQRNPVINKHNLSSENDSEVSKFLSLKSIMALYFQDNPLINELKPLRTMLIVDPLKTPSKRKCLNQDDDTIFSKITKIIVKHPKDGGELLSKIENDMHEVDSSNNDENIIPTSQYSESRIAEESLSSSIKDTSNGSTDSQENKKIDVVNPSIEMDETPQSPSIFDMSVIDVEEPILKVGENDLTKNQVQYEMTSNITTEVTPVSPNLLVENMAEILSNIDKESDLCDETNNLAKDISESANKSAMNTTTETIDIANSPSMFEPIVDTEDQIRSSEIQQMTEIVKMSKVKQSAILEDFDKGKHITMKSRDTDVSSRGVSLETEHLITKNSESVEQRSKIVTLPLENISPIENFDEGEQCIDLTIGVEPEVSYIGNIKLAKDLSESVNKSATNTATDTLDTANSPSMFEPIVDTEDQVRSSEIQQMAEIVKMSKVEQSTILEDFDKGKYITMKSRETDISSRGVSLETEHLITKNSESVEQRAEIVTLPLENISPIKNFDEGEQCIDLTTGVEPEVSSNKGNIKLAKELSESVNKSATNTATETLDTANSPSMFEPIVDTEDQIRSSEIQQMAEIVKMSKVEQSTILEDFDKVKYITMKSRETDVSSRGVSLETEHLITKNSESVEQRAEIVTLPLENISPIKNFDEGEQCIDLTTGVEPEVSSNKGNIKLAKDLSESVNKSATNTATETLDTANSSSMFEPIVDTEDQVRSSEIQQMAEIVKMSKVEQSTILEDFDKGKYITMKSRETDISSRGVSLETEHLITKNIESVEQRAEIVTLPLENISPIENFDEGEQCIDITTGVEPEVSSNKGNIKPAELCMTVDEETEKLQKISKDELISCTLRNEFIQHKSESVEAEATAVDKLKSPATKFPRIESKVEPVSNAIRNECIKHTGKLVALNSKGNLSETVEAYKETDASKLKPSMKKISTTMDSEDKPPTSVDKYQEILQRDCSEPDLPVEISNESTTVNVEDDPSEETGKVGRLDNASFGAILEPALNVKILNDLVKSPSSQENTLKQNNQFKNVDEDRMVYVEKDIERIIKSVTVNSKVNILNKVDARKELIIETGISDSGSISRIPNHMISSSLDENLVPELSAITGDILEKPFLNGVELQPHILLEDISLNQTVTTNKEQVTLESIRTDIDTKITNIHDTTINLPQSFNIPSNSSSSFPETMSDGAREVTKSLSERIKIDKTAPDEDVLRTNLSESSECVGKKTTLLMSEFKEYITMDNFVTTARTTPDTEKSDNFKKESIAVVDTEMLSNVNIKSVYDDRMDEIAALKNQSVDTVAKEIEEKVADAFILKSNYNDIRHINNDSVNLEASSNTDFVKSVKNDLIKANDLDTLNTVTINVVDIAAGLEDANKIENHLLITYEENVTVPPKSSTKKENSTSDLKTQEIPTKGVKVLQHVDDLTKTNSSINDNIHLYGINTFVKNEDQTKQAKTYMVEKSVVGSVCILTENLVGCDNNKLTQTDMQDNNNTNSSDYLLDSCVSSQELTQDAEISSDVPHYICETEVIIEENQSEGEEIIDKKENMKNTSLQSNTSEVLKSDEHLHVINKSEEKVACTDVTSQQSSTTEELFPKPLKSNESEKPVYDFEENDIIIEKSIKEIQCEENIFEKSATLVYKDDSGVILKGIEYEDPEIGTCYVFPLAKNSEISGASDLLNVSFGSSIEVIHELDISDTSDTNEMAIVNSPEKSSELYDEIDLKVIVPKLTYLKRNLKRKSNTKDVYIIEKRARRTSRSRDSVEPKSVERKFRKGKNIDYPRMTASSIAESSYGKEFKRVLEYYSNIEFSFSITMSEEFINVPKLLEDWPIKGPITFKSQNETINEVTLFKDLEEVDKANNDPLRLTFVEEITTEYKDTDYANGSDNEETNLNMGFGEGSGRVIQNLNGGAISKFSAATLSDVKQSQPFLLSTTCDDKKKIKSLQSSKHDQIETIKRFFKNMKLREKVRSFFRNIELELSGVPNKDKNKDRVVNKNASFPFEIYVPKLTEPRPIETILQVVQVGQLPVSAAAQNPVTCDPRVTQVSNASPPQCSAENSPHDDSQSDIKTEYTELTTADLSLPMVEDYVQHNQAIPMECQEATNVSMNTENIPIETELVKSEVKIELEEDSPEDKDKSMENHVNDVEFLYDNNHTCSSVKSEFESLFEVKEEEEKRESPKTFPEDKPQKESVEKTDQIAHAMNAAGITTTSETVTNTRAQAFVNMLSQKIRPGGLATPNSGNNYAKTSSINAMALQQALAQILPPPLNQTNSSENNQQGTPQLLHIVQGKNASGNQITLVDNSQQSVITTPNATPVLHIVQNKAPTPGSTSNGSPGPQTNTFSGISLVDAGLQQGGNQLLHIVNTGNQKNNNTNQLLKRVNLLTNLANVQGSNEQKMVQFVCKSADGKSIQLNAPHQRSMVLRLQPIESPNVQPATPKPAENQDLSPTQSSVIATNKETASTQQEIKSRSVYEENYAKFIQNSSNKPSVLEKSTSLPKFNQAFGKPVFQDGNQKQNEINSNNLSSVNTSAESTECSPTENSINLDHIGPIRSPPLLIRKSNVPAQTSQAQTNLVQQIKQTIAPMNIQTMHGGVIYTRQIPVNIGGGQTINLITVPSTELIDENGQKQQVNQGDIEPSIIKIVPQNQPPNAEVTSEGINNVKNDNAQQTPPQPQPVLTQMRIKLPMLSKNPHMVSGARVVRPSFFQIQRNIVGGANQPVYQQLVLTTAPPLGQQTIRLPQAQARTIKVPENQSESQMSSSTLEQLREFDMVLEQVKERSTVQPNPNPSSGFKLHTASTDTTDSPTFASSTSAETTTQVLYSIGSNQSLNVTYVNRKSTINTPTTSTFVRSPDSSGIADSPSSSSHVQIPHTVTTESSSSEASTQSKPVKVSSKSKSRPKSSSHHQNTMKLNTVPPKTSSQKPLEDEQTTQRILYILAEYKEQVENSPDKDKPAPRRRSNPPSNPGSSKRKKSSSGSRRSGTRDLSPILGEDSCRTMGSEDSSCGTSQGDCNESCLDSHSPQDSPRKVVRKLAFEQEPSTPQPKPQPQRNVIVADGQTITVARGTTGKPATAVLMPANYILPVSMVKGGQQIAIVTNRGPKLLTVGGGEGGATNALLLQRLIGPAGLKPVLARPGVRHVRLPTAALHNLQAFNLATATTVQPPDSTASPASETSPPDLIETNRSDSSPWADRDTESVKPDRASSPDESEPWNLPSSADPNDYSYEEIVRTDNLDQTVLDPIPDRYSPDMEAQRIFDKMFDVDTKKSSHYIVDSVDSSRCGYDIDESDCDVKPYQVVQKKDSTHRQARFAHVSAAALRHKYAILEHELRLQKSLSEECEDLGVDSPSASELFPEAELLFAASPAQDHASDTPQHSHTQIKNVSINDRHRHTKETLLIPAQPTLHNQSAIQPDVDDQIATDHVLHRENVPEQRQDLDVNLGLEDVGIVTVSEDGMQATIALDQEEFARAHPNTTFHSEPTDDVPVQPFTITGLKSRHITSTIFHSNRAPATVLMTAPQATVISQVTGENSQNPVKYSDIDNMINAIPSTHTNAINLSSVLVKDDRLTRFDNILTDSRELHLSNTASAIVHSASNATQVIRRVCYDDNKRERESYLMDEPDALIAGDDAKMVAEDSSRDATMESMGGDVDDGNSSPERHAELFWESNSASERSESRRPLDFSSDSEKCCKSPSYDETNSTDSSGVGTHMRLDSVIKEARGIDRSGSADGSSADDTHPPLRTYPAKRLFHSVEGDIERSLSGKTRAGERSPDLEVRRRASGRGVVKRGCHCCNGSPAPPRTKKPRQRKPTTDFTS